MWGGKAHDLAVEMLSNFGSVMVGFATMIWAPLFPVIMLVRKSIGRWRNKETSG